MSNMAKRKMRHRPTIPRKEERQMRRLEERKSIGGSVYRRCLIATSPRNATDVMLDMSMDMLDTEVGDAVIIDNVRQISGKERELCGLPKISKKKQEKYHQHFVDCAIKRRASRTRDGKAKWNERMLQAWDKGHLRFRGFNCYCGDVVIVRARKAQEAWAREIERRKSKHKRV
jgi:hypothetical protein